MVSLGLAFLAGVLTILSPCVLPLLPLILASAVAEHRLAPAALAVGVGLSFAIIGGLLAGAGFAAGLHGSLFRSLAALALIVIGAVLVSPALQATFAVALGPIGNWANATLGDRSTSGLYGQFALGVLLGAVWTPCVGPTLGAASLLAAHGKNLASVAGTMFVFGAGTSVSLALLGLLSRSALMAWRSRMLGAGHAAKTAMGGALAVLGVVILAGMDKPLEAILVDYSPDWLTQLTTLY